MKKFFKKLLNKSSDKKRNYDFVVSGEKVYIPNDITLSAGANGKVIFEGNNYIGNSVEIGAKDEIKIGLNTSIQHRCILLGDIEIGANCLFADNVYISSGRHNYDLQPEICIKDQDELVQNTPELSKNYSKKVTVGDDCWLGTNSVIMSGITIGKGAIIGANSVVTKDVLPYTIVGGIPAKVIKNRLEFNPSSKINASNNCYLPYFYKGFYLRLSDLEVDRKIGGIAASDKIIVALQNSNKLTKIVVELKKNVSENIELIYDKQSIELNSNDWLKLEFDVANYEEIFYSFEVKTNSNSILSEKVLYIKEIRFE